MPKAAKFNKTKNNYAKAVFVGGFIVAAIIIVQLLASSYEMMADQTIPNFVSYHAHVDFKVIIDGKELDFNKPKYDGIYPFAHLHLSNPNGDKVIHFEEMPNITIGVFFESLGMKFDSMCFILDDGTSHCNYLKKHIRFFVNGKENFDFDLYWPQDGNRILITYGNYNVAEIEEQIKSVTNDACIYSKKCPERIPLLPIEENKIKF